MEEGGFLKWFPNVSLENQMLIACSVIIAMMQVENISVDEGTRIRHRELSHSLSEVALMMKSIIILFVIHVVACDGVNGISVQKTLCSVHLSMLSLVSVSMKSTIPPGLWCAPPYPCSSSSGCQRKED